MTYAVTDACIKCKYMDCVAVCPMDCFHEGAAMLVIHPDECIDCGICVPECPVDAIRHDSAAMAGLEQWLQLNREFASQWPNITSKAPPEDADAYGDESGKFAKYFSTAPGRGD